MSIPAVAQARVFRGISDAMFKRRTCAAVLAADEGFFFVLGSSVIIVSPVCCAGLVALLADDVRCYTMHFIPTCLSN